MTDKLPPNLLALFAPRPGLRYLPPSDKAPEDRRTGYITGVGPYLDALKSKQDNANLIQAGEVEPGGDTYEAPPTESWLEARDRKRLEKAERQKWLASEGVKDEYKPKEDGNIRGDAFHTLFIARLPYDTTVQDLEREFGRFGPIERVRVVADKGETKKLPDGTVKQRKPKSKGYAFVVFERERDMKGTALPTPF